MDGMAATAPETIAAGLFAATLPQLLVVAGGFQSSARAGTSHERNCIVRKFLPGSEAGQRPASFGNPCFPQEMALPANTVAAPHIELRRVHDGIRLGRICRRHPINVDLPRPVTALAANASFSKRQFRVTVLRSGDVLNTTGMAFQTFGLNRAHEKEIIVVLIARGQVPFLRPRIVRNRRLKKKTHYRKEVASSDASGSNEINESL